MSVLTNTANHKKEQTLYLWVSIFTGVSVLLWIAVIYIKTRLPLRFDDAYMFYRYAQNLHSGHGMSWNLSGLHTFGETSLFWGAVVWILPFLAGNPGIKLQLLSSLCSGLALFVTAWTVSTLAHSRIFQSWFRVLPFVAVPLLVSRVFVANLATGMETMLAMALVATYAGMVLQWMQGRGSSVLCGFAGLLLFLTRPEAGIVVVLFPCVVFLLLKPQHPTFGLAVLLGTFFAGVILIGLSTYRYFGTVFPLSFYVKGQHFYEGYRRSWFPVTSFIQFLGVSGAYLAILVLWARRSMGMLIATFMVPLICVSLYLLNVLQIMGFSARYFIPYLPLVILPSLLALDQVFVAKSERPSSDRKIPIANFSLIRLAGLAAVVLLTVQAYPSSPLSRMDRIFEGRRFAYDEADRITRAPRPLPDVSWQDSIVALGDGFAQDLPAGVTFACSEVGYIGAIAPQLQMIDLSGLNDAQIALQGFNSKKLLDRRPDLIWLPHFDYTFQRGEIFAEPEFLSAYTVYDGAFQYGVAILKDSPYRAVIETRWKSLWDSVYPGIPMNDYTVQSVHWNRTKREVF